MTNSSQYQKAGVDVEAGDALVDWLQKSENQKQIHSERILSGIGGFASVFNMQFPEIKKPCLVTCTDGVGTKVKWAAQFQKYEGIGQDLVAMCVNDLICTGGRPLLFLDYYATGKLDIKAAQLFLQSIRKACADSSMALVGGETAEMPGVYHETDFDCAGFAVGIVDQDKTLGPHRVRVGDVMIGLASSGFHSNGYSLLRKVFADDAKNFINELMTPTKLYVDIMMELQKSGIEIHAAAHITGGGLDNIPRVLPEKTAAQVKPWTFPKLFAEVQKRAGMSSKEMLSTLNCGLGFVIVAPASSAQQIQQLAKKFNHEAWDLGQVTSSPNDPDWFMEGVK